ncbi:hypothetical protein CUMW_033800 [Citrus unshiu]|nr:hypothetical protein CUMW_033800 [Citrus unshiu]
MGAAYEEMMQEEEGGCSTPTRNECRIPAVPSPSGRHRGRSHFRVARRGAHQRMRIFSRQKLSCSSLCLWVRELKHSRLVVD